MAAATGGEAERLSTVAEVYCQLVVATEMIGDTRRFGEWAKVVAQVSERRNLPMLTEFLRNTIELSALSTLTPPGCIEYGSESFVPLMAIVRTDFHRVQRAAGDLVLKRLTLRQLHIEQIAGGA